MESTKPKAYFQKSQCRVWTLRDRGGRSWGESEGTRVWGLGESGGTLVQGLGESGRTLVQGLGESGGTLVQLLQGV